MAKIAIYHMTRDAFLSGIDLLGRETDPAKIKDGVLAAIEKDSYVYCARVKTEHLVRQDDGTHVAPPRISDIAQLERAWAATQNIEEPWPQGENIVYSAASQQRSSMVGDIFVYDARAYIVASFGFREIADSAAIAGRLAASAKAAAA